MPPPTRSVSQPAQQPEPRAIPPYHAAIDLPSPLWQSQIICGDVVTEMDRLLADAKCPQFDVVIADPPYNIGKRFESYADNLSLEAYVEWVKQWLGQCLDLLANDGLVYVYGFPEILARIAVQYPIESQRWLAWHYTNKAVPASTFWQRSHESILCLWKPNQKRPQLEIDQIREPYTSTYLNHSAGKTRRATPSRFGGNKGRTTTYQAHHAGALPRDVLKIPALAGGAGASQRWFICHDCDDHVFPPQQLKNHKNHHTLKHPTQKPAELTARLLRSRIQGNQGNVLIPFAGSGSECVVAQSFGVNYLGIEINPQYVQLAKQWLAHTQ